MRGPHRPPLRSTCHCSRRPRPRQPQRTPAPLSVEHPRNLPSPREPSGTAHRLSREAAASLPAPSRIRIRPRFQPGAIGQRQPGRRADPRDGLLRSPSPEMLPLRPVPAGQDPAPLPALSLPSARRAGVHSPRRPLLLPQRDPTPVPVPVAVPVPVPRAVLDPVPVLPARRLRPRLQPPPSRAAAGAGSGKGGAVRAPSPPPTSPWHRRSALPGPDPEPRLRRTLSLPLLQPPSASRPALPNAPLESPAPGIVLAEHSSDMEQRWSPGPGGGHSLGCGHKSTRGLQADHTQMGIWVRIRGAQSGTRIPALGKRPEPCQQEWNTITGLFPTHCPLSGVRSRKEDDCPQTHSSRALQVHSTLVPQLSAGTQTGSPNHTCMAAFPCF